MYLSRPTRPWIRGIDDTLREARRNENNEYPW